MNDFAELRKVVITTLRWWWLLVIALGFGIALGYLVSQLQTPIYQATATLLVGQSIQSTELDTRDIATSEQLALTYAHIARLQPVLQEVAEKLNLDENWRALKGRIRAAPVEGTQLLRITVESESPEEAQSIANGIANLLILLSPTSLQQDAQDENQRFVLKRLETLRAEITEGQKKVDELESAVQTADTVEQIEQVQSEIHATESLIVGWENNYTRLLTFVKSKGSPNYLAIVESAQASPNPIRPRIVLNVFVMGMVGLAIALVIIFLLEYLNKTIKPTDDIEQSLGLTVLGTIGHIPGKQYTNKLITFHNPLAPVSEAFQILQSNIQFMHIDQVPKSFVVTSPNLGEGKSIIAANLGVTMAQAGFRTIVVDANLWQPVLHQIFQVSEGRGVLDFLQKPELEIGCLLRNTEIANLQVISSGVTAGNLARLRVDDQTIQRIKTLQGDKQSLHRIIERHPVQLLVSSRIEQLSASLCKLADVVIFDSPPVLVSADAAVLSKHVDGVVMVAKVARTQLSAAKQAALSLARIGANLLGIVLNQIPDASLNYDHYPIPMNRSYYPPHSATNGHTAFSEN